MPLLSDLKRQLTYAHDTQHAVREQVDTNGIYDRRCAFVTKAYGGLTDRCKATAWICALDKKTIFAITTREITDTRSIPTWFRMREQD